MGETLVCPVCDGPLEPASTLDGAPTCPRCASRTLQFPNAGAASTKTEIYDARPLGTVGRFELQELVGSGAFGQVYRAVDPDLLRTVAVKIPRAGVFGSSADGLDRFLREARATAKLDHPSIVRVFEVGSTDRGPYLVSEFVEGVTLADWLTARQPVFEESAELIWHLADALECAHRNGVVHRDVKPSNVMLARSDSSGREIPRLMDFGLARRDVGDATMTTEGQVLGTPAYMSPEQARGEGHSVDGRADQYSLGVVLYLLLTGEAPFRGNLRMLMHQVINEEPQPPRKLNDRVPRDLETICLKCMSKEPSRRYGSCGELAADLRRYLDRQPIVARPISTTERVIRWCWRNRAISGLATLLAVVLVSSLITLSLLYARAELAREHAENSATAAKSAQQAAERDREVARTERNRADESRTAALREQARAEAAEQAAKSAAALAVKSKEEAEAVARFLVEVFRNPAPEVRGRDLRVVELLDPATDELLSRTDLPESSQANFAASLAGTWIGLGDFDRAVTCATKARDLRSETLGPQHPDTLEAASELGWALTESGQAPAARKLLEETLAAQSSLQPAVPERQLRTRRRLGWTLYKLGDWKAAAQLLEQTLTESRQILGEEHADTLWTINALAVLFQGQGRADDALRLFRENYETTRRALGASHPQTLRRMNNLATVLRNAGQTEEALALNREAYTLSQERLGAGHPHTLMIRNNLGAALLASGDTAAALTELQATLAVQQKTLQEGHPHTLNTMANLAQARLRAGRIQEGLDVLAEVAATQTRVHGENHPDTLAAVAIQAWTEYQVGNVLSSLPRLEDVLRRYRAVLGGTHPETIQSIERLALAYAQLGRVSEALPLQQELHRIYQEVDPPRPADLRNAALQLAVVLTETGRAGEAVPLLQEIVAEQPAAGAAPLDLLLTRSRLAAALVRAGQLVEALQIERQLREALANIDDPQGVQRWTIALDWAEALAVAGQADRSAEALQTVADSANPAPSRAARTFDLTRRCGRLLEQRHWPAVQRLAEYGIAINEPDPGVLPSEREPTSVALLQLMLSVALLGEARLDEGEATLKTAHAVLLASDPQTPLVRYRVARACQQSATLLEAASRSDSARTWKSFAQDWSR